MQDHPILAQVVLGYSPMIDRERSVMATRLTVFPARPDAPLDAGALLAAVAEVWPDGAGKVSLNIVSESLLHGLMLAKPSANLMVEVPAFMAADLAHSEAITSLFARGNTLMLKGRPRSELPREVLPCFKHSIIDLDDERRTDSPPPPGVTRQITHVQAGVRTLADLESSFQRGAVAVLGWPIEDAVKSRPGQRQPEFTAIVELMRRIDNEESIDRLEDVLKLDPTLAFKLLRYINSAAFGLRVEVGSFRHALMLLGHQRLKRWLALLLASASKERDMKPVMFSALRRGLLMEQLARASVGGGDEQMRNEAFICGVFSLLDRMMAQPFEELLKSVPVPDAVRQALVESAGPYQPFLEVVRAVENESIFDIRDSAERLLLGEGEINRAVLAALATAAQLQ
ncbi:MAG TPA: HDOD domain-containing protein [Burkholderiaceae bacterium]|jgi:EAL and modified HD-GYP domain-containing signal transduction protein|nr:HDOD domain-containing protein [Burkholderiaceae bacterium]